MDRGTRRALLGWGLGSAGSLALGCDGCAAKSAGSGSGTRAAAATASALPLQSTWRELDFAPSADYDEPGRAVVLARREPVSGTGEVPLLIALHGAGEAAKGLVGGSRGWRDDYDLDRCEARLRHPPLATDDFLGFVRPERLAAINASLAERPFGGLCVACPYARRIRSLEEAQPVAAFFVNQLAPRVRKEVGCGAKTGIDGVSMGGRLALLVGLSHPEAFDAIGALQPALAVDEADWFADLAARAMDKHKVPLRLVSSESDPFLDAVMAFSEKLRARGIGHQLLVTPGPHDYVWNRGPGAIEMLLWHDRVLRGAVAI